MNILSYMIVFVNIFVYYFHLFTCCSKFWYIIYVVYYLNEGYDMSTKTKSAINIPFIYTLSAVALTVISVILRCVGLFFFYDTEIGYFSAGAPLPIIANILLLVSVVFFALTALFKLRKVDLELGKKMTVANVTGNTVAAIGAAALTVFDLTSNDGVSAISVLLSAASVAYFVLLAFRSSVILKVILGALTVFRLVLMVSTSYFNQFVQMNSPDKIVFHLACVSAMLFIVSELRILTGTEKPSLYLFSSATASLMCGVCAIPSIIAYHARLAPAANDIYEEYYLLLGICVLSAIRLITVSVRSRMREPQDQNTRENI